MNVYAGQDEYATSGFRHLSYRVRAGSWLPPQFRVRVKQPLDCPKMLEFDAKAPSRRNGTRGQAHRHGRRLAGVQMAASLDRSNNPVLRTQGDLFSLSFQDGQARPVLGFVPNVMLL